MLPVLRSTLLLAAALPCAVAGGCGPGDTGEGDGLRVVATTTHVGDLARTVGGPRIQLHVVLAAGADPHAYEPRPSDARALAGAALVLRSGGDVDAWLDELLESTGGDPRSLTLLDRVAARREGNELDPHWWHDPRNAIRAVGAIRQTLVAADPAGSRTYARRASTYVRRLRALDRSIAACLASIPRAGRRIVTSHDSFGYLAGRYDVELVGAVIPSLSSQAQPSARDVEALVDRIRSDRVRAVFPERSLPARLERAVAREAGASVGKALWADSLGPEGSDGATYTDALRANARSLGEALGANARACAALR